MVNKVRVYGKAQNRTALGIVNAYLVIYPQATLEDLRKAFPDSLNPDSGVKINFVDMKEIKASQPTEWDGFFSKPEEILHLHDGTEVALVKMWTKPSFERLASHAAQYGIEIAKFEEAEKGAGKKGGFRLEYLNGFVPAPLPSGKSKKGLWIALALVALALIGIIIALLCRKPETVTETVVVTETVIVHDTLYIEQLEEIEKNFNAAQFVKGKADLTDDAKFVLHDLAKLLEKNPELKLSVIGHTSAEGDPAFNRTLSEKRAKAAVDFLVGRGIAEERLQYIGKGSDEPLDANNPEVNRRTEFQVIE